MKRLRGEITVFLTCMIFIFLGFFAVLIEGIRVQNAKASGERALNLGLSSAFTKYYSPLWEEYHLFGRAKEGLEEDVKNYLIPEYGLLLKELEVEEIVWGIDYEGKIFLHQVQAYEKYQIVKEAFHKGFSESFTKAAEEVAGEYSQDAATGESVAPPENLEEIEEGREERRKMKGLKELWSRNILEMVLDNPSKVSKKKLSGGPAVGEGRYSLSSTSPQKNLSQVKQFLREQVAEQAELLYYQEHFKSYCKKSISFQKEESLLDYELEYLLEGKGSDRDNLEAWLRRLVLTRTTLNYLVINQDNTKRQAAYEMAFVALGFTGLEPLVRAGQQFILLGWGYEEALIDARVLLQGGQVSLWKGKQEFSLSFGEIFTFSEAVVREKAAKRSSITGLSLGMNYEEYISLFLGFKKEEKRRMAAWYLIDENIKLRYDKRFSLQDTVFGTHIRVNYMLPGKLGKDWSLEVERHYSY